MSSILIGVRRGIITPRLFVSRVASRNQSVISVGTSQCRSAVKSRATMMRGGLGIVAFGLGAQLLCSGYSECASGSGMPPEGPLRDIKYFAERIVNAYAENINQLGFSGVVGVCAGFALKRVSQEAAVAIGSVFILLQGLSYMGYININYKKISDDVTTKLDVNRDGKLSADDVKAAWSKTSDMLSIGLPNATGFAGGFALGFYLGN